MKYLFLIPLMLMLSCVSTKPETPIRMKMTVEHVEKTVHGYEVHLVRGRERYVTVSETLPDSVNVGREINITLIRRVTQRHY